MEIKDADPDQVLERVVNHEMLDNVFFWCRNRDVMKRIRSLQPKAHLMATRWMFTDLESTIADYQANIVEYELGRDDFSEILKCQSLGVKVMAFSLTHDPKKLRRIQAVNADLVNLDRPDLFKLLSLYPQSLRS